ncbi:hypothetical protein EXIGLDRAFT_736298 [Exidia glandulosa HHB12029]|uniref:C2H2-type domain-containing protein n=1 Tax=Exidia glandulosa HHB12029 TaxID=1314781 RepID=A0A166AT11_EXIGL|nr:hypothetical protein EXIGLDRAFT_736298 [Exidia glandulosa HHB12029]
MDIVTSSSTLHPPPPHSAPASPRLYVCGYCARTFVRKSTYMTHENTHTHTTSYVCTYPGCGRHYTVPGNAYRHIRVVHPGVSDSVRKHVKPIHGAQPSRPGSSDSYV